MQDWKIRHQDKIEIPTANPEFMTPVSSKKCWQVIATATDNRK